MCFVLIVSLVASVAFPPFSMAFADRFVDLRQVGQLGCTHKI